MKTLRRYKTLADYFDQTGRTQQALAEALGISPVHMSSLVRGDRQPSLPLALRISELTGVPIESLAAPDAKVSK